MFLTIEKLQQRVPEIIAAAIRASLPIADLQTYAVPGPGADSAMSPPPPADAPGWAPLRAGDRWGIPVGADPQAETPTLIWGYAGDGGSNHWLRASLSVPAEWQGHPVVLTMDWDRRHGSSVEAIAYLDGTVLAGLDEFHHTVLLPAAAHIGAHELLIRCLTPVVQRFGGLSLQLRDQAIFRLGHTMRAQLEAVSTFQESDLARHALIEHLNAAYNALDLREGWGSQRFADSARVALALLTKDEGRKTKAEDNGDASVLRPSSFVPTIVATGHAHLDIGWLWPVWRTRQKVAHTVATALHLMERYPDYHFSMSQPQVYHFLKHDAPDLYARMKARIAEGRFEPVGLMWLETDCNIPSGESLVRQLAHGARFFAEEFPDQYGPASDAKPVVWLPDVFGYSAALPQLMRGCGIASFMTTKISWNQFNRMPNDTFRWRGIDGSEVLTHFVTASDKPLKHWAEAQFYTYNGMMSGEEAFGTWKHYRQKALSDQVLYIYGYGDGGGGPTEEMLEAAGALDQLPGYPNIKQGRIDEFFTRLYRRSWDDPRLPTWAGELYLEYHRGTYTSQSRTKQANRAAELLLREAEWLNAWATTRGAKSQQSQLDAAWQILLLQQFHDILPGSSIPQVYIDSNVDFGEIQRIGRAVREAAAKDILTNDEGRTTNMPTDERSLVVWNSLAWERHEAAQIELASGDESTTFAGPDGGQLTSQIVEQAPGKRVALVETTLPAYSYAEVSAANGSAPSRQSPVASPQSPALVTSHSSLANGDLRLELNEHGEISSLYDLRHGRETIAPGATANQLVIYEDRPLNWSAWDIDIFYEEKPYPVHEIIDWRVAEEGPLRSAIVITRRVGQSTITQRIQMWRDARRIDFVTEVDWQERETLLRALFPLNLNATRATCEIQFGAVERPTHRNTSWDWARFEVCAHRWVDLSEGGYGVALLNDGKYGHSLSHNTLGLSLLKGAIAPAPDADIGIHRFTYSLLPHAGDWREAEVTRRAYELNAPLFVTKDERRKTKDGDANPSSFVNTPTANIVVETVKVAHDGDGLIVRLYEAHNQRGQATLVFGQRIAGAVEVNLLEREVGAVEVSGNQARFQVRPFEVKTLRVRLG